MKSYKFITSTVSLAKEYFVELCLPDIVESLEYCLTNSIYTLKNSKHQKIVRKILKMFTDSC